MFTPEVRRVAPYFVLAFIVFAAYIDIFNNVFLFDDNLLIQLNTYLQDWSHIGELLTRSTTGGVHIAGGFYRPAQMILYLFIYHLGGGTEFWFHLLNLSLHMVNTCLVYKLGTKLGFNPWAVFLAALVWGLHPLHTEAITYMSATADPLFAMFCLWAIIFLLPDFTPGKILKAIPLFLLGLCSKEAAVMLPLLVMICLFFANPQRLDFRIYIRTWPLWVISLIYVFWRTHASGFDGPQTYEYDYSLPGYSQLRLYAAHPMYRIYTFFASLPLYLQLLIYPAGLHMERNLTVYPTLFAPPVLKGLAVFVLAAAQIVRSCRRPDRGIEISWGLLWFAAAHGPDSGILIPVNSLFLEHWMYLPSVGLFLGLAQTAYKFLQDRPRNYAVGLSVITLIFAGALAVKTYSQNKIWHDPDSFYHNIFAYGEVSARAHNNLALYYSDQGRYDEAVEQFKEAIKTSDVYPETRFDLALTYLHMPPNQNAHVDEAIANLKRSIEIDPNFYRSYNMLGNIYEGLLNDPETAKRYHDQAEEIINRQR